MNFKAIILSLLFLSCNKTRSVEVENPSIISTSENQKAIENLVRKLYEWHETNGQQSDFFPIEDGEKKRYIGVDFKFRDKRLKQFNETNFFTQEFLDHYKVVYQKVNNAFSTKKEEWFVGEIPPVAIDNLWYSCQDYPEKYWKNMSFKNFQLKDNKAFIEWQCAEDINYKVGLKKVNSEWKINYLQGFDLKYIFYSNSKI